MRFARLWFCEHGKYELGLGCAPHARNMANDLSRAFFEMTLPNPPYCTKTHVFMRLARFRHSENCRYKLGLGCAPDALNMANELYEPFLKTKMPNPPY